MSFCNAEFVKGAFEKTLSCVGGPIAFNIALAHPYKTRPHAKVESIRTSIVVAPTELTLVSLEQAAQALLVISQPGRDTALTQLTVAPADEARLHVCMIAHSFEQTPVV